MIQIIKIEFANGQKFESINVDRKIHKDQLKTYKRKLSYFVSKRTGKEVTVLLTYREM